MKPSFPSQASSGALPRSFGDSPLPAVNDAVLISTAANRRFRLRT